MEIKVPLTVVLQQKQFVDKNSNVINYLSISTEIDGVDIVFYPKDGTSKQLLNKYYVHHSLDEATKPSAGVRVK